MNIKVNGRFRPAENVNEVSRRYSARKTREGRVVLALPSNNVGLQRVKWIGQSRTEECNLHRWGVTGVKKG